MKNKLLHTLALLAMGFGLPENAVAQQQPTYGSPGVPANGNTSLQYWSRAGNTGPGNTNNIFGTLGSFNSPIYTVTNGAYREKLNGDFNAATQYPINTYNYTADQVNTSGYLLLGPNTNTQGGGPIPSLYQTKGAFSLLHLNGIQNSITGGGFTQEYGYRPWMKTGITFTGNNDLMYLGIRALAPGQDLSEMVVSWSDNSGGSTGPDDFAFRFIGLGADKTISSNLNSEDDLDGRHIARFAPTGEMGLGNTFGAVNPLYVRPQSLLHMSLDQNKAVYMQITNQNGTGQTAGDGLKVGYAPTAPNNLEARINQQENDRLGLYTNNGERIRVTHIGALNNGITFNPGGLTANLTRIGISHNPATPVTRPLSLLHLGYDVQGATNDGWRPWMDVGIFVSNQSDNVYIGMKQEAGSLTGLDRQDAVLAWGDNQVSGLPPGNGPDNFRFIFASTTAPSGGGVSPATGTNGLETARITPFGNWGIGNFYNNPLFPFGNPVRRMEILSDKTTANSPGNPQLRITNFQQDPANPTTTGRYAEIIDIHTGDLIIGTRDNTLTNTATRNLTERFMGINTLTVPGNTLEINSQLVSETTPNGQPPAPGYGAPTGWAGLRFTDLTANSNPQNNPGKGILAIDESGDVIYVPATAGASIGNYCSATPNPLAGNYNIPLHNFNYYFSGDGPSNTNSVSIGQPCTATLTAKFNSYQNAGTTVGTNTIAGWFSNEDIGNTPALNFTGISASATGVQTEPKIINIGGSFTASNCESVIGVNVQMPPSPNNNSLSVGGVYTVETDARDNYGVVAQVTGNSPIGNTGVVGMAANARYNNYGGYFYTITPTATAENIGVNGSASGSQILNIGGAFSVQTPPSGATGVNVGMSARAGALSTGILPADYAIAVYGNSTNPNNGLPGYAGYFDGDVFINGPTSGTGFVNVTSDAQFKTNLDSIHDAVDILSRMQPKTFYFDTTNIYGMNFSHQKQYGLIAQEVEIILPELVSNISKPAMVDTTGNVIIPGVEYKTLNYNAFIAILIKGMQEQQSQITERDLRIDDLNTRLENLENCINALGLCDGPAARPAGNNRQDGTNTTDVRLQNVQSIVLEQNVPNPFAEQTVIDYFLPDDTGKAQMLFYNAQGKLIQTVALNQKGQGQLNVFGSDLSSGVYTYTLVVDGRIIETKKMVKL